MKLLVVFAAIAVAGAVGIEIALTSQHHAPQPPVATATAPVPSISAPTGATPLAGPPTSNGQQAPTATARNSRVDHSAPTALVITSLGVRARFVELGLNTDGTLQVPADVTHVGWYTLGPSPGQDGPAVILGHVDSASNGAGVFFKLGAAKPGDTVTVTRADGMAVTFAIYAVREYPKDSFPTTTVYGNTAGPELRLITCGGGFDKAAGHYRSNVVAFARQIGT